MIDQTTAEGLSKLFGPYLIKEFLIDLWLIFKAAWWVIPIALLVRWVNRKIDKRK